jgi:hypothetical protein
MRVHQMNQDGPKSNAVMTSQSSIPLVSASITKSIAYLKYVSITPVSVIPPLMICRAWGMVMSTTSCMHHACLLQN